VNVEALPYTLFLLLTELAIGSLWVTLWIDLRGQVTRGFVLTMALCIAVCGGLAIWSGNVIDIGPDIDGFPIDEGWFEPAQRALLFATVTSAIYMFAVFMGWDPLGRIVAIAGSAAGVLCVVYLAAMLEPPTWGYAGVFAALMAGTLAMGAVSTGMTWGHWYLTEGRLPAQPMRELSWILIGTLVVQIAIFLLNIALPERITPTPANPIDVALIANPMLWFRVGVGFVFSMILAVLTLRTAQIKAMQSATGLLYICMGTVFTGELLSKGLMFLTGKPI
jgi:hypothetical protein